MFQDEYKANGVESIIKQKLEVKVLDSPTNMTAIKGKK